MSLGIVIPNHCNYGKWNMFQTTNQVHTWLNQFRGSSWIIQVHLPPLFSHCDDPRPVPSEICTTNSRRPAPYRGIRGISYFSCARLDFAHDFCGRAKLCKYVGKLQRKARHCHQLITTNEHATTHTKLAQASYMWHSVTQPLMPLTVLAETLW